MGLGFGPVSAAVVPKWTLLRTTDQGSSGIVAPFDSAALAAPGTGFDPATGIFTWVFLPGDVTRVDGYTDPMVRWTKSIPALYPDFDIQRDIVDIALEVVSMPLSATIEKFGFAAGILDHGTSDIGSSTGTMLGIFPNTAAVYQSASFAASGASTTRNIVGVPDLAPARYWVFGTATPTSTDLSRNWRVRNTADVWDLGSVGADVPIAVPTVLEPWRIHVGHIHNTVIGTAGSTMQARVYHRRIRSSGLALLPS